VAGKIIRSSSTLYLASGTAETSASIIFTTGDTMRARFSTTGHFHPETG
jgi:hypothetical protein